MQIDSLYVDRSQKSPHEIKHEDIYVKMLKTGKLVFDNRKGQVTRVAGCPVSVAEQVLALVHYGDAKNPYFAPNNILRFNLPYLSWRTRSVFDRFRGKPYQIAGPTSRGDGRPAQNLPPSGAHAPLEYRQ